jgi:polysaccharide export outer membrane protein
MQKTILFALAMAGLILAALGSHAAGVAATNAAPASRASRTNLYVLSPKDIVQIRVYQEEDLFTEAPIARDGSIRMPLLGPVNIGGKTIEEATTVIRDALAKDYLVNPQVSILIKEFAKRHFVILGQVNRPGPIEMPSDESVNLLQAIGMAGGYTKIGSPSKIKVKRTVNGEEQVIDLNADKMAKDKTAKPFEILPDDVVTVGESIF